MVVPGDRVVFTQLMTFSLNASPHLSYLKPFKCLLGVLKKMLFGNLVASNVSFQCMTEAAFSHLAEVEGQRLKYLGLRSNTKAEV